MIIAQEKRRTNKAEYLLYMWQVEDLIRACRFDPAEIDRRIVSQFERPEEEKRAILQWYTDLAEMMKQEQVTEKGHLQINKNTLTDLADLHHRLLTESSDAVYTAAFYRALPHIVELRSKAGKEAHGEIETCLEALYGALLLRLQGKELSEETRNAIKEISSFIALLANRYQHQDDEENHRA